MSKKKDNSEVRGPQLAFVVCGEAENAAITKLNLNCPLGIFLSYSLQTLRVELDKKKKEVEEQVGQVFAIIPPDTSEEQLEEVTTAAKEKAAAEKERLQQLAKQLGELGGKMAAATAHNIELVDESNGLLQCQENIKLKASEVLKSYGKYIIGLLQESEVDPPSVLPLIVGASAVVISAKKGK